MQPTTRWTLAAALVAGTMASPALAQSLAPAQGAQSSPQTVVPEKVAPDSTGSTTDLSEKLNRTDGVIAPPSGADSGMTTIRPAPGGGAMPVITPPGEPGGNQAVQPK